MKSVVYLVTQNWYEKVLPSIRSLLVMTKSIENVYVLCEDDDPEVFRFDSRIKPINVSKQRIFKKTGPNYVNKRWSYMVLMKAAIYKILPEEEDLVLALDADTIHTGDISDLWSIDMTDYYVAGVKEPYRSWLHNQLYVNGGVLFMNLEKLRDGKGDEIVRDLNTKKFEWLEQDAINFACRDKIYQLPAVYNVAANVTETHRGDPKIFHFAARPNDWFEEPLVKEWRRK